MIGRNETVQAAAAVADNDLEFGKSLEHFAMRIKLHRDKFLKVIIHLVIRRNHFQAAIVTDRPMHHQRHVELDRLLVKRMPILLVHARRVLVAGGIGVQIGADKTEILYAAFELGDTVARIFVLRLRQLCHTAKAIGMRSEEHTSELQSPYVISYA